LSHCPHTHTHCPLGQTQGLVIIEQNHLDRKQLYFLTTNYYIFLQVSTTYIAANFVSRSILTNKQTVKLVIHAEIENSQVPKLTKQKMYVA